MAHHKGHHIWHGWLAFVAASFAALETWALRKGSFPPLSHTLRRLFGIPGKSIRCSAIIAAVTAGWLWLLKHLFDGVADPDKH